MHNQKWEDWEIAFLRLAYPLFSNKDISYILNRTTEAIRRYATYHKIGTKEKIKIGDKFNRLTIIEFNKIDNHGNFQWYCKCKCGNIISTTTGHLKSGHTKSCGCQLNESRTRKMYGVISSTFFNKIKAGAKARGIEFNITQEILNDLYQRQNGLCTLTGLPIFIKLSKNDELIGTASVDRIDSSIGYIPSNIQFVHKIINIMKQALPQEDFINWCHLVVKYANRCKCDLKSSDEVNRYAIEHIDVSHSRKIRGKPRKNKPSVLCVSGSGN